MAAVSIKFIDKSIDKNGCGRVIIQVLWTDAKREVFTGVKIKPEHWDYEKKIVRKNHSHASDFNLLIEHAKSNIINILTVYRLRNEEITPKLLDAELKNPSSNKDFLSFIKQEINERTELKIINFHTKAHYMAIYNYLFEFTGGSLHFSEFNDVFLKNLTKSLKERKPGTVKNYLKMLKIFVGIAIERKFMTINPFIGLKMPKIDKACIFLNKKELQKLWDMYESKFFIIKQSDYKERVAYHQTLAVFLFLCNVPLRITEFRAVDMVNIIELNGRKYLKTNADKGGEQMNIIPLSKHALQLINDFSPNRLKGHPLQFPSNEKMNLYLKEILISAGIDKDKAKKMTLHKSRHTFATICISENNSDIVAVSKLLGHKKTSTTLDYYSNLILENKEKVIDLL